MFQVLFLTSTQACGQIGHTRNFSTFYLYTTFFLCVMLGITIAFAGGYTGTVGIHGQRRVYKEFSTAINDLFSIFYNVLFFANFMDAVGKGKIMAVDVECFDNPEYYDNVTFALNDLFNRMNIILNNIAQFISHFSCVIVMISLLSVLLGLFFEPIINQYRYRYTNESLPYQRKYDYVKRISIQAEYAQELRTTNVKKVLHHMLDGAYGGLRALLKQYYRKITALDSVQVFFGNCTITVYILRSSFNSWKGKTASCRTRA